MILQAGTISVSIAAVFGGLFSFVLLVSGIYIRRALNAHDSRQKKQEDRLSTLEQSTSDQRVMNQEMLDYKTYRDMKDDEFSKSVKLILEKLESLNTTIHTEVTELKVKIAEITPS
jgi:hypothetical protein